MILIFLIEIYSNMNKPKVEIAGKGGIYYAIMHESNNKCEIVKLSQLDDYTIVNPRVISE
mgnify:CR=1 FL=1